MGVVEMSNEYCPGWLAIDQMIWIPFCGNQYIDLLRIVTRRYRTPSGGEVILAFWIYESLRLVSARYSIYERAPQGC
jgi:hypothetical protein